MTRRLRHAKSIDWQIRWWRAISWRCDRRNGEIRAIAMPDSRVNRQSSMSAWRARAFSSPRWARTRSPRRRARMMVSVALWNRVNSSSPDATSVRCGLRGISAVTSSAAMPPTTPSISRSIGELVGMIMTMRDWMAAAIANPGCAERKRATASVAASARPSCHHPVPAMMSSTSATRMPTIMPITVSRTRRGRASRTNPRLETVTVAASSGASCPRT